MTRYKDLYSYPVYAFIRRRGYSRLDAQDLTQVFIARSSVCRKSMECR